MKPFLMYRDRDFAPEDNLPPNAADLKQDLELDTLFAAMADNDSYLLEVAQKTVLASLDDPQTILYRQHILADCLINQPEIARLMYGLAGEAIEREKKIWPWASARYPRGLLYRVVEVLQVFLEILQRLRSISDEHAGRFSSEGFRRLFGMIARELDDTYLTTVKEDLDRLKFRSGILMSAALGKGNKGADYVLCRPSETCQGWVERFQEWLGGMTRANGSRYVYEIADRDEAGHTALSELQDRGISRVAAALAQSADDILGFFKMLRFELGFYVGCLNLRDQLTRKHEAICLPEPLPADTTMFSARGLYDACLSLTVAGRVVANDLTEDDRALAMITGANRGGKSTFLRSVGLAQVMMQCGMFVPAKSFRANVCRGIFTHFRREEDNSMHSGKLDEELSRMSSIIDSVTPTSLVLLNESFASTNEREGSEIARQIVQALLKTGIKVFYVTHMFDLAQGFYLSEMDNALFLRAERLSDGQRTFRLVEGKPLPTSYGEDLYRRIFGVGRDSSAEAGPSVLGQKLP